MRCIGQPPREPAAAPVAPKPPRAVPADADDDEVVAAAPEPEDPALEPKNHVAWPLPDEVRDGPRQFCGRSLAFADGVGQRSCGCSA
jgi:hypothetical protein